MFSINGTGLRYMGFRRTETKGHIAATLWITFLFLPLIPLRRHIIQPIFTTRYSVFQFNIITKCKIVWTEILKTYLCSWTLMPLMILWPIPFAVKEIQDTLKIPSHLQWILMFFAIAWLIVSVWKLKDWDSKRPFKLADIPDNLI